MSVFYVRERQDTYILLSGLGTWAIVLLAMASNNNIVTVSGSPFFPYS
jgi:hypothetical protein